MYEAGVDLSTPINGPPLVIEIIQIKKNRQIKILLKFTCHPDKSLRLVLQEKKCRKILMKQIVIKYTIIEKKESQMILPSFPPAHNCD